MLGERFKVENAAENLQVQKRNALINSAKQMDLVSEKPKEQLKRLRVNEGVMLFIEDKSVVVPREQIPSCSRQRSDLDKENEPEEVITDDLTKWEREFELEANRFTIKFNDPFSKSAELDTTGMNATQIQES